VGLGVALAGLYLILQVVALAATDAFARAYARLSYLYRTGQRIRASLDVSEVLSQVARDATVLGRGQYGLAVVQEGNDGGFIIKAGYDHKQGAVTQHHRKMDEWFLHRVTASRESLATTGAAEPYRSLFGFADDEGEIGLLGVPLNLADKVIGIIIVVRVSRPFAFTAREINMVEELAEQAAMAIEQANLLTRVRSYASELELSYDSTLKALMAALDTKDAVTEGHSERVAHLTVAVARELGIPEEQLTDVERGALLHDVGKIGVPDSVLRKPQALSRKEWQAMQKHPLLSGILVSKVGVLEGALPILLYHHERYDGQGYPFGLLGDKIPLEARIFAVVDAYDAMTSDRPYRAALPHQEAMAEIVSNAGTQFDPAVTEAFAAVVERMHAGDKEAKEAA
jgi:HD-GYP domain-containing protein (c-di-GMP phosphodiesterase class II)